MLEGSEVLGIGLGSCPLPGFVTNRVRFWRFCERVYCVKHRYVICGTIARATSSGRSSTNSRQTVPAAMIDWLVAWIVRWVAILALLNVLTDVLPSYCLVFNMQVLLVE